MELGKDEDVFWSTGFWKDFVSDWRWLGCLAFIITLLPLENAMLSRIIGVFAPIFLYTLNNKNIMRFGWFIKFAGLYVALYFCKMLFIFFGALVKQTMLIPILIFIKLLIFVIIEFIFVLLFGYIVNLVFVGIIKLLSKNKYTQKIVDFFENIFIKSPEIMVCIIVLAVITTNITTYFIYEKGRFDTIKTPITVSDNLPVTEYEKGKLLVIYPALSQYYTIDTITKNIKNGMLAFEKAEYTYLAKLNDKEMFILTPKKTDEKSNKSVNIKILNLNNFSLENIGDYELDINFAMSLYPLDDDRMLILGGAGHSKQAYIYENRAITRISDLPDGYIEPKIIKLNDNEFAIVGNIEQNTRAELVLGIDVFDKNSKTFTKKLRYVIDGKNKNLYSRSSTPDNVFLNDNRELIIVERVYLMGRPNVVVIDTNDFKVISNENIPNGSKVSYDSIMQISDNKLLLVVGYKNKQYSKRAYIYDVKTKKLSPVNSKRKTIRANGKAIKLSDGRIIIYGGTNGEWANHKIDMFIPQN